MPFRDEDVAIRRYHDAGGLVQGIGRITGNTRFADCHEGLTVGTELDDGVAFSGLLRMLLAFAVVHAPSVHHPDVAVGVYINLVREDEHAAAERLQEIAGCVEPENGRKCRSRTTVELEGG